MIILNVTMNSLVFTVSARCPQLREDRKRLFMVPLSMSDLAAGCTFMPISAAMCSGKVQGVADEYSFNPKVHALTMNWFGFNSIHSLYWLTIYKTISILMLFRNGQCIHSQMLLHYFWNNLDCWMFACNIEHHSEVIVEYCIMFPSHA